MPISDKTRPKPVENIKVAGGTLAEDTESDVPKTQAQNSSFSGTVYYYAETIAGGGDVTLDTVDVTYAAGALVHCAVFSGVDSYASDVIKLRLFMGGVQMQESAYINSNSTRILRDFKVMSGLQTCSQVLHNYSASGQEYYGNTRYASGNCRLSGIAVGSSKLA
jgi:hypothetical protein